MPTHFVEIPKNIGDCLLCKKADVTVSRIYRSLGDDNIDFVIEFSNGAKVTLCLRNIMQYCCSKTCCAGIVFDPLHIIIPFDNYM
ncbi:hypothetical protein [Sigmofec virus UA08Rod_4124]|uniref:Uncharacterized protein n=1 Tax=Sigmofec virus UA08Rod_4124 TaxID=2929395 RepID=A0A976R8N3_9VIRU|nr:hypothetical protein [Sigmofec virus UA08Rod_4124]